MAALGLVALLFPWLLLWYSLRSNFVGSIGDHALFAQALLIGAWACWLFPVIAMVRDVRAVLGRKANLLPALCSLIAFSGYAPLIAVVSLFVRPQWKGRTL